jgi:uncharacterized membrane protein YgcG
MCMKYPIALLLCVCTPVLFAYECITTFKSEITVDADASLLVRETITVQSAGVTIIHGIVREFPTRYTGYAWSNYTVDFDLLEVTQDGVPAEYTIKEVSNGEKIYIGDKHVLLPPGEHVYTLLYKTNRQLGFFADYDELYWNITGNGWRLPIENVEATVYLPSGISKEQIKAEAYTGTQNDTGNDYRALIADDRISFKTTRRLERSEGITCSVRWPKGFVTEPLWSTQVYWFLRDNIFFILAGLFFLLLLLWCCIFAIVAYRKNRPGTIIPLFYPPDNMAPSAVGFMSHKGFKDTFFAPDIVDLAVRGFITISYDINANYTLGMTKDYALLIASPELRAHERQLLAFLFSSETAIRIDQSSRKTVDTAIGIVKKYCTEGFGHYLARTKVLVWIGTGLTFLMMMAAVIAVRGKALPRLLLAIVIAGIYEFMAIFFKAYTSEGRKLQDAIDGFKLFLTVTEKERFKIIGTPPTKTPELYEKYLPYAMVLGVEEQWTKQFTPLFMSLEREGHPYVPLWYIGRSWNSRVFATQLNQSLNSSISSAASSSFGGSKGSGGGRGGGGGGGW